MCSECPLFEKKLCGSKRVETKESSCATCQTTRDAVSRGEPLGCSNCYTLFADLIYQELTLPLLCEKEKFVYKSQMNLEPRTIDPRESRLPLLKEALQDAIKQENYEQAASLRDQIQLLLNEKNDD